VSTHRQAGIINGGKDFTEKTPTGVRHEGRRVKTQIRPKKKTTAVGNKKKAQKGKTKRPEGASPGECEVKGNASRVRGGSLM